MEKVKELIDGIRESSLDNVVHVNIRIDSKGHSMFIETYDPNPDDKTPKEQKGTRTNLRGELIR